jgi:hypothetical protein
MTNTNTEESFMTKTYNDLLDKWYSIEEYHFYVYCFIGLLIVGLVSFGLYSSYAKNKKERDKLKLEAQAQAIKLEIESQQQTIIARLRHMRNYVLQTIIDWKYAVAVYSIISIMLTKVLTSPALNGAETHQLVLFDSSNADKPYYLGQFINKDIKVKGSSGSTEWHNLTDAKKQSDVSDIYTMLTKHVTDNKDKALSREELLNKVQTVNFNNSTQHMDKEDVKQVLTDYFKANVIENIYKDRDGLMVEGKNLILTSDARAHMLEKGYTQDDVGIFLYMPVLNDYTPIKICQYLAYWVVDFPGAAFMLIDRGTTFFVSNYLSWLTVTVEHKK